MHKTTNWTTGGSRDAQKDGIPDFMSLSLFWPPAQRRELDRQEREANTAVLDVRRGLLVRLPLLLTYVASR